MEVGSIHIPPRRLAGMLDNAILGAKQGNKPFPWVLILIAGGNLVACGTGQHIMVEDHETGATGMDGAGMALPYSEAEQVAKAVRGVPGAGRKDMTVHLTVTDSLLKVEHGDTTIAEVADIGPEADEAWELRLDAQKLYEAPLEPLESVCVYDLSILTTLGKLKPAETESRLVLWPNHAANTTMWRHGSIKGFIEGNRTPAEDLFTLWDSDVT